MSQRPAEIPAAREPEPEDSAAGILVERDAAGEMRLLLALRSRRARFMPGHLSFPGGRLERADGDAGSGGFARCASREVAEETGIEVSAERWLTAGERITPPMFPVRFRTRFFLAELPRGFRIPTRLPAPGEIEGLRLARAGDVLDDWQRDRCRVPPPVLPILREVADDPRGDLRQLARAVTAVNAREQRAPRIEFTPDQWMLPVRSDTLPPATHTNCWLVGGKRFVIVDPGSPDEGENQRLLEVVGRRAASGHRVEAVVLTHAHRDHVGGVGRIAQALGLPVRAHAEALERIERAPDVRYLALGDDEALDLDGVTLRALYTPGHAPGHLAFQLVERGQVVSGDLVSGLSTILIDPDEGDMEVYLSSLERVRQLGCRWLLPGHGPPLPVKALGALVEHRLQREGRVLEALAGAGAALREIARQAYPDALQMPLALLERQTLSHLLLLERRGRVRRQDAAGRAWVAL